MRKRLGLLSILGLIVVAFAAMAVTDARPSTRGTTLQSSLRAAPDCTHPTSCESQSADPVPQASYLGFDTLESLSAKASTVAKGRVLSVHADRLNFAEGASRETDPLYLDCTVVDFKVLRAIKGPIHKNEVINIAYLAQEDVPGLKTNASSLVFLTRTEAGPYMPLNPSQAVMRIENGRVKANTKELLVEDGTDEENIVQRIAP